jgi:hypothetical protein
MVSYIVISALWLKEWQETDRQTEYQFQQQFKLLVSQYGNTQKGKVVLLQRLWLSRKYQTP